MFGSLGMPEIVMILVLALLIFGPKRLPEIGRTVGKGVAQFRRASNDLRRTIESEISTLEDGDRPPARELPRGVHSPSFTPPPAVVPRPLAASTTPSAELAAALAAASPAAAPPAEGPEAAATPSGESSPA